MFLQAKTKFPIIRRTPTGGVVMDTHALMMSTSPENESMSTSSSPISSLVPELVGDAKIMTKAEYSNAVHSRRDAFLRAHFDSVLQSIGVRLQEDAKAMRVCRVEASFAIPDHFDRMRIESIVSEYFHYLGYDVIFEDSPSDLIRITIQ
jgi:hypothetical protein